MDGSEGPEGGLRQRLERLVIANSKLRLERVDDEARLNFELGFDSHALLNLLLDIEDRFGLEVPPEEVPELVGIPFAGLLARVAQHETRRQGGVV